MEKRTELSEDEMAKPDGRFVLVSDWILSSSLSGDSSFMVPDVAMSPQSGCAARRCVYLRAPCLWICRRP